MSGLSRGDFVKLLLGTALVGGSARAGLSAYRNLSKEPDEDLDEDRDLYEQAIPIPVAMSPAEYARLRSLRSKQASAWDNTLALLIGLGGAYGGWSGVDAFIKRRKSNQLKERLEGLKREMRAISAPQGMVAVEDEEEAPKLAYVSSWLEEVASVYAGEQPITKLAAQAEKSQGFLASNFNPYNWPGAFARALGSGAAAAGSKAKDTAIEYLGPIAALSLLLGIGGAYSRASSSDSAESAKRKAVRRSIRQLETQQQPFYVPVPYVKADKAAPSKPRLDAPASPLMLGLGPSYTEADTDEEQEEETVGKEAGEKSASMTLAALGFGLPMLAYYLSTKAINTGDDARIEADSQRYGARREFSGSFGNALDAFNRLSSIRDSLQGQPNGGE